VHSAKYVSLLSFVKSASPVEKMKSSGQDNDVGDEDDDDADLGKKLRHSLEPNKYPYISPSMVSISDNEDVTDTARYPLVKAHGTFN